MNTMRGWESLNVEKVADFLANLQEPVYLGWCGGNGDTAAMFCHDDPEEYHLYVELDSFDHPTKAAIMLIHHVEKFTARMPDIHVDFVDEVDQQLECTIGAGVTHTKLTMKKVRPGGLAPSPSYKLKYQFLTMEPL